MGFGYTLCRRAPGETGPAREGGGVLPGRGRLSQALEPRLSRNNAAKKEEASLPFPPPSPAPRVQPPLGTASQRGTALGGSCQRGVRRKPLQASCLRCLGPFGAGMERPLSITPSHRLQSPPLTGGPSCPTGPRSLAAKQASYFKTG